MLAMASRLEDVAARAGVSAATVSRVVNGKQGVSEKTRRRVAAEIEFLGYQPARRAPESRSGLVGLIVPELDNPVFPSFVQAMESELAGHGYAPFLCSATLAVQEDEYIDMLLGRGVSGLIFICGRHANAEVDHSRYQQLRADGVTMVLVNGWLDGLDAPFASTDDVAAMQKAVHHLRDLGHTRIGCAMGPTRYITSRRKVTGFLQGMARAHRGVAPAVDPHQLVVNTVFFVEGGPAATEMLIERGCTAIVCGSDVMALGAIRAGRAAGLRVPQDLSVVGYDDSAMLAFTDPPLTTMRQDVIAISRHAVNALFDEIGGTPQPRRELLFQAQLVVRGSTAPVPTTSRTPIRATDGPTVTSGR